MPKTKDAFALRGLYEKYVCWQEKYQDRRRLKLPITFEEEAELYRGGTDIIEEYLGDLLPYSSSFLVMENNVSEIAKRIFYEHPRIERSDQAIKRIERHIGRLKSYSQKIFDDVLTRGFTDALRTKGNRVKELIRRYEFIATFLKDFRDSSERTRDYYIEDFQRACRKNFGDRLRQARIEKNISIADMASMLGLTRAGYGNYELGKRDLPTPKIYLLAKILDVSLDWLFGLKD